MTSMPAAIRVRTAYPFHAGATPHRIHWACLLECGHTVELDLEAGSRPRRLRCPRCGGQEAQMELCFDFGE